MMVNGGQRNLGMAMGAGLLWLADSMLQTALAGVLEEWTQLWGRSVLFLVLLASGGYLLLHHNISNSNPTSPPANSTPCDCTISPPPPCECKNTTTEADEEIESISSNNRRPSINLQIICPTPPPLVDRQGSTSSWGEHLFHTPPPYQTPHPGVDNSSQAQPNPIHVHLCQEDH